MPLAGASTFESRAPLNPARPLAASSRPLFLDWRGRGRPGRHNAPASTPKPRLPQDCSSQHPLIRRAELPLPFAAASRADSSFPLGAAWLSRECERSLRPPTTPGMPRAGSGKRFRLEPPAGRKHPDSAWSSDWDLGESNHPSTTMSLSECYIAVKLADQPLAPKSILRLPESELGECPLGGCSISYLKQLITGKLQESIPDPEFIDLIYCGRKLRDDQTLEFYGIQSGSTIHVLRKSWPEPEQKPEPVDKMAAVREFRVLHTALHSSPVFRDSVFKMLGNKESLDQIIVATPGLSGDPIALGVLQDKDLFSVFADPAMLDTLIPSHPALVNAIVLVLHSVAGSAPLPTAETSSRSNMPSSSYRDMPGGFLFEGLSDDEDDFHQSTRTTPSSSTSGSRPASLGYTGAAGPRPITQSELATALALASTPESSSHTPTPGTQGHSSGTSPMSSSVQSGTPITNDLFSQALQHALQASGQPNLQSQWQPQLQQLRDMGIHDDELSLRALQATGGDIQAALELIFAGGAP